MGPVSLGCIPPHLRVPAVAESAHRVADKMTSTNEEKEVSKQVLSPAHLQPAAATVQPAPEPYILPHLRVSSSNLQTTVQPGTQESSPQPSTSTSSNQPTLQPSSQQSTSQPTTLVSSNPTIQGPTAVTPAVQVTAINPSIINQQFYAANMRSGINVRKCEVMNFYRHGPNPVEPEYELYTHSVSESSRSSGSSYSAPIGQAQTSALQQTAQHVPETTAAIPQNKIGPVMNQVQFVSTSPSGPRGILEMSPGEYKQYMKDQQLNATKSVGQGISQTDLKISNGREAGDSTTSVFAPVLPEVTPVISQETVVSQNTAVAQGSATISSTSDATFTAAQLSFMQSYAKPVRRPHEWKPEELKELHEYERLMKIKAAQPRAPGVVSIDEFMASRRLQGSIANKYGAPKKVTTPPGSPKPKTPSPKIRRAPMTIDPFRNPAWNLAGVNPSAFMAHVNARAPDGKSKKYSGKAINQPEVEDLMSTRRAGTQVWIDTVTAGGEHDEASAEASKKENVAPALEQKLTPQKPVVDNPLVTSKSVKFVPPHLRVGVTNFEQKLPQKPIVEASVAASSSTAQLPPHLRAGVNNLEPKLSQKLAVPTSVAVSSSTVLPPHLRVGAAVNRSDLEQKSLPQKSMNSLPVDHLSPHLRGGMIEDGDLWASSPPQFKAKENVSLATPNPVKDAPTSYVPPHLRVSKQPELVISVPNIQDLRVACPKDVSPPDFLPPHLRRDFASQKPAFIKAFLDNLKTKDGPNPSNPGFLPLRSGNTTFGSSGSNSFDEAQISEDGLDHPKENIRATQGRAATDQLLDFDGTWIQPRKYYPIYLHFNMKTTNANTVS